MIATAELHRMAAEQGLRFDQVEKDYIILWILSALSQVLTSQNQWFFKGGTCLRHCFYPGYRFSEDIDFSCSRTGDEVRQARDMLFRTVAIVTEKSGVLMQCKELRADPDNVQLEIPIEYSRGGPRRQSLPVVKVHLSFDEPLLTPPEERQIRPSYTEPRPFTLMTYSKIEMVAEKIRALLQQQEKWPRPRDLYDLWYITCFKAEEFDHIRLKDLFKQKCRIRGIPADIQRLNSEYLREWNRKAWTNQLSPMLGITAEYDVVWNEWIKKCEELFGAG